MPAWLILSLAPPALGDDSGPKRRPHFLRPLYRSTVYGFHNSASRRLPANQDVILRQSQFTCDFSNAGTYGGLMDV